MEFEEPTVLDDDFYSFLNVSKEASKEDIANAYRRLSRMYHPDKHTNPEHKAKAEQLFNKTKRAYEVLSDPHQRAIYDSLGIKGLETEGWELVQRTKTPSEIRAEYERLAEEREERLKQRRTNPTGSTTLAINATDLFNTPYDVDEWEESRIPNIEFTSMTFSQSVDFPLTQKDSFTLSGQLHTQNGTGGGVVNFSCRHIFSHKTWCGLELAAGNLPGISFKAFRTLSNRCYWNGATSLQFTPKGLVPGLTSTLAMRLGKYSMGFLTYETGVRSMVSTSVVCETECNSCTCLVQVGLPHSFVSASYSRKLLNNELKLRLSIKWGTFGGMMEYGAEKKVSKHSTLSFGVSVGLPSGVKLKIRVTRANQTYSFPIHLCEEEIVPSAIFYGTVIPLAVYFIVKRTLVEPFLKEQHAKELEKQKSDNLNKLLERRREAMAAQELMATAYARIRDDEMNKNGLVIIKAIYGKLEVLTDSRSEGGDTGDRYAPTNSSENVNDIVDVTIPVQCLVKDSKLELTEQTKSQISGFFDTAIGERKRLHVIYNFRQQPHEVTILDNEPLRLPRNYHRVNVS